MIMIIISITIITSVIQQTMSAWRCTDGPFMDLTYTI